MLSKVKGLMIAGAVVGAMVVGGTAPTWAAPEAPPVESAVTNVGATTTAASSGDDDVATLVAKVAPDQGDVIRSTTAGAVSGSPADPIMVPGENGSNLGVRLPPEVTVGEATAASDGTVVYSGTGEEAVDVAVQAMDSGAVRIQTIINAPSSPHAFTYALEDGSQVAEAADGSIWAVVLTEAGEFQAYSVGQAWARDANGDEVATHYEVRGNELVQVVSPTEFTVYPIVADPTWQWYSAAYGAGFSKAETGTMAASGGATALCVLVPAGPLQIACGLAGAYWFTQASLAANAGGCVFYAAVPAPLAMRWLSPECK